MNTPQMVVYGEMDGVVKMVVGNIIQMLLVLMLLELIVNGNITLVKKKIAGPGILQIQVLVLIIA